MKFTIEIDSEDNPDAVGEYLRSFFFDEKIVTAFGKFGGEPCRQTGCYMTFDWRPEVKELLPIPVELNPEYEELGDGETLSWTRGSRDGIECRYYWDGDGELVFTLPDGSRLVNDDCKKSHGWYLTIPLPETAKQGD